ncbi:MAG: DUF4830 domain-containing protein [Clostridia bacterium]|nr:DUF4830 domain-containing protein [Clostridia bacterium]
MKKLLPLLAALLLALPLFAHHPAAPAQAEDPQYAIITLTSAYNQPDVIIDDAAFLRWLLALLAVDAPCEAPETRPADDVYEIAFFGGDSLTYTVWHDDLYNRACVTRPDGSVHTISINVPQMLSSAVCEPLTFAIPESHRSLLQRCGWTVAFRHPHMALQLPASLTASRTDATALHFTWADLFLRDAGFDITPYLGQAVVPYVYTLYETMPRAAFYTDDTGDVRCTMRAVVLECDGQVIGAYLFANSWDGSTLMSLKGNAAPVLLGGMTVQDYLLARLPLTEAETELAALTPEEVIRRYAAVNDPMLLPIGDCLRRLATASTTLWDPLALLATPTGQTALTITERSPEGATRVFDVDTEAGSWYPRLIYESDATGWKVESFYNTGY